MFHKPFKIKSQTLIKKSDKKKLHDELLKQSVHVTSEALNSLLPLKEDLSLTRITTSSQKEVNVYIKDRIPVLFSCKNTVLPTVYALWKFPDLLVKFRTHTFVVSKLKNGSDLMLPGVLRPKSGFETFKSEQPCSVVLVGSKTSLAVGLTTMSSNKIEKEKITTGKLVLVQHTYGDHLWLLGDKSEPQVIPDEDFNEEEEEDEEEIEKEVEKKKMVENEKLSENKKKNETENKLEKNVEILEKLNLERDEKKDDIGNRNKTQQEKDYEEKEEDNDEGEDEEEEDIYEEDIPESKDELIEKILLFCLKEEGKFLPLPLLTNLFYTNHLLKYAPTNEQIDIKKTSYKKFSSFLSSMQQEGLLTVEQLNKGVDSLTSVTLNHPKLIEFVRPAWQRRGSKRKGEENNDSNDDGFDNYYLNYTPPQFTYVYLVSPPLLPFLNLSSQRFKKGDKLIGEEVRGILTQYVKDNNLQDNKLVNLDPWLTKVLYPSVPDPPPSLEWKKLMENFIQKFTLAHETVINGRVLSVVSGKPKKITFEVKQKASNKKVTIVKNLHNFALDLNKLASFTQKSLSVSVQVKVDEASAKKDKILQIQGNQINFFSRLLTEKFRLSLGDMTGLENAIKKKRKC